MEEKVITGGISLGLGFIGHYFKDVSWIIAGLMAFIVLDVCTGLLKAWKNGDLSSSKSREGVIHKVSELLALTAGFGMDLVIPKAVLALTGKEIDFKIFGLTIAFYLILTELLSIVENLSQTGVSLPEAIVKRLQTYKQDIDGPKAQNTQK